MSGSSNLLLPIYHIRKQTKTFNEKNLIILLLVSTVLSLFFLLKQLPSNVSFNNPENVRFFIPKIDKHNDIIHNDTNHIHNLIIPPPPDLKESNVNENPKVQNKNQMRQLKIKNMTKFAWKNYRQYAWGRNELKPMSRSGHQAGIFGGASNAGATIIDAVDTLYIMGLEDEVKDAQEWIFKQFSLNTNSELSAFEVNIRFVGGLLAIYTLTKEKAYLDKAAEVADLLLPIFDTPTGIPYALVNPQSKHVKNYNWAAGGCSILAEFGSLSLEFEYLTDLTGNQIYKKKIDKIFETLKKAKNDNGLWYNYLNQQNGKWCSNQAGLGGLADSFYEYLIKLWIYQGKKDKELLDMYLNAIDSAERHFIRKSSSGFTYAGEYNNGAVMNKMGHLACFTGGMFALTAMHVETLTLAQKEKYEELAKGITNTCHESYVRMPTHIGPESFNMDSGSEFSPMDRYYILRPETVESYFYLWRMTKDEKYRDWAWDAVEAIEKHCRSENGYSGLRDVATISASQDDVQQSFFFAETLKYLYLIFGDDTQMSLDKYVFNTEAHPFLIKP